MKIENSLKLHSHYLEELFGKMDTVIEQTQENREKISVVTLALSHIDKNITEIFKNQKNIADALTGLTFDQYRRLSASDFFLELTRSPKSWLMLITLTVALAFSTEVSLSVLGLLKHWI